MKIFKKIFLNLVFILALHTTAQAGDNPFAIKTSADNSLLLSNKKHKLLQMHTNGTSLKFNSFLRVKNTKQSKAEQILSWDMKFKFRLSHNLNIIFSYN